MSNHSDDMNIEIKACVIGCGVISENHIISLKKLADVKIVALCDIDKSKAIEKKKQHGLDCNIYTDYLSMLECENPDAVHILTPHYLHTEMTLEALKRNINVFLEKPICIDDGDIEKIKAAEADSTARVCICFQTRFNRSTELASEYLTKQGGAKNAYATVIWNRGDSYYNSAPWRGKKATEGGGVMINQAIHTIDLLCYFLGKPKKIQAIFAKLRKSDAIDVEDMCDCQIEFENGKQAIVFATTNHAGCDTSSIHLESDNSTVDITNDTLYINGEKINDRSTDPYIGKRCYGTSHPVIIEKFYTALLAGTEVPVSIDSAEWTMRIVLASYYSNGKTIEIN